MFLKSNTGVYTLYESHTKCIHYMAEEARVLARITSKIKEFIQYYGFTKATYRDAKMKKLEEFWRENAVGIGLYNECVLWWGVRFERLLAALKSKRHKTSIELLRF